MIPVPVLIGIAAVVGLTALFLDDDKPESTDDGKPAADPDVAPKPKPRKKRARKAKPKPDDEPGNIVADLPASGGAGGVDDADTGDTGGAASDGAKSDDASGDTGGA